MTEIQIKNLIKEYEKEYIEFMEIEKLPEQRREILKMSVYGKMSYPQIAEITGLSVNTIKTHMKKAYQDLRESLYDQHDELFLSFILMKLHKSCEKI